jgi:UDP-N-acetylglucosamine:LPS N-acetylglucosamine transferase
MIGYYVHHHGFGHLARAISICEQMRPPVTLLTSRDVSTPHPFAAVVKLPRDDRPPRVSEPTAHGALHWVPHHYPDLTSRMNAIARWIADAQPEAVVVDVSVEVAVLVRLLGIPVIVMALPGKRIDAPHLLVHRLADHIVATWPEELCVPPWLRSYQDKTSYVGGISRFDGREFPPARKQCESSFPTTVLILGGADGLGAGPDALQECTTAARGATWTTLGASGADWTDDPWPQICAADIVVTHAGQSCVADVAAAQRPAVVIPRPRPFDEQLATARVLRQYRLAVVAKQWPDQRAWPALLTQALTSVTDRWHRWRVRGAAARAADAIEATARRYAGQAPE